MKRFVAYLMFIGLVGGLAACSGDSPSAPPVPTVIPDSWTVNVTADPSSQFVGNVVTLTAEVGKNGSAAPDGTTVIFQVSGAEIARVASESGFAITGFSASVAGTYTATARVNNVFDSASVTFSERDASDAVEIHRALPSEGSYDGGEQVTLYGKGIVQPVEVNFNAGSNEYLAEVVSVQESVPLEAAGSITVRTPYFGDLDRTVGLAVDVTVKRGVSTDLEDEYTLAGAYTLLGEAPLQIIQPLIPNSGSFAGGEPVRLNGRGIRAPARVVFIVEDEEFPADVQTVVESVPLSATGYIDVLTPYLSGVDTTQTQFADVLVQVAIDQPNEEPIEELLPGAFVFGASVGTWQLVDPPSLYLLIEDHGPSSGGETVTLLGKNFRARKFDNNGQIVETAPAILSVTFGDLEAQVLSVSADGTQAQVITPRYSVTPLEQDEPVTVEVTTRYPLDSPTGLGPFNTTKQNAYIYLADEPTPELTGLAPIAGPLDGGTIVTLFGHGFQVPVQVTFGVLECENVNVNDDQSLADADTITCAAPDYSQQNEVPPVEVDVVVRNVLSGKESEALTYTYGDNLYITGNTPTQGRRGDMVIIYGSGFEDPLAVDFLGGDIRMDVIAVSGTELLVRFPLETDPTCVNRTGAFRVTLFERDGQTELGTAEGGNFTYLGNTPVVANVAPLFVESFNDGEGVSPSSIVITGQHFSDEVLVDIGNYRMSSNDVDVVDEGTIEVDNIPAPNDFALVWDTMPCTTTDGFTGIRNAPTPVDITVTNFPAECPDTLTGAIIYEPDNTDCVVSPNLVVTAPVFQPTSFPACSPATPMTVQNTGQGTLDIQTITLLGDFFFDAGGVTQLAGPLTLDPFAITSVDLYFCPGSDDNIAHLGQAVFVSNDPDSPTTIQLSATELAEALIATAPFGDGDVWTFAATPAGNCSPLGPADSELTISNIGDAALTGSISVTGPFDLDTATVNIAAAGAPIIANVQFCPVTDNGLIQNGLLTITSNASNFPTINITLRGQETP